MSLCFLWCQVPLIPKHFQGAVSQLAFHLYLPPQALVSDLSPLCYVMQQLSTHFLSLYLVT